MADGTSAAVYPVKSATKRLQRQLIQAVFWSAWVGLFVLASAQAQPLYSGAILIAVLVGLGCWAASERLRYRALHQGWLELGQGPLLLRLMLALALLSACVQLFVFSVLMPSFVLDWVSLPDGGPDYRPGMVVIYWFNSLVMLAIWSAGWFFFEVRARHRRLEQQHLKDEVQRRVLELDSLRSRLNPHFVFNALNNVRALINEDTERARELVTRLSNTLRYALYHNQQDAVTLEQELAVVNDYLAIEQVHYEGRLQVVQQIAPQALTATLPPMLLQLLVENGIKHGIAKIPAGGTLMLTARLEQGSLQLMVSSPGGLNQTTGGVGLAYLQARLKTWSKGAHFTLDEHDGQVTARLYLPQEDPA